MDDDNDEEKKAGTARIPLPRRKPQLSSPSTSSFSVSRDLSGRSRSRSEGLRMRFRGVRFRELKAIMFAAATTGSFYTRGKRAATF